MTEQTVVLGGELDRLDAELDEIAAKLRDADPQSASAQALHQHGNDLDQMGGAVAYLVDEHGPEAEVTVRGLTAGEYARVQDRTAAMREQADQPGGLPGSSRNVFAAMGLVDAPFLESEPPDFDARIQAIASQPIGVSVWVENRVNELTTVSAGNWTPLPERLLDTQTD